MNIFKSTTKHIYTAISGFMFAIIISTSIASSLVTSSASALSLKGGADCSSNSVIKCGLFDTTQLSGLLSGQTAIKDLYASSPFNISQADLNVINNTSTTTGGNYTVAGSVDTNNNVIVGGKVVATNAITAGRNPNSQDIKSVTFAGTKFYVRHPSASFAVPSLDAFVVMKAGVFQYAILTPCGNPVAATPVPVKVPTVTTPIYQCVNLTLTPSATDPNTVLFQTSDNVMNGPVFQNVTYNINNTTTNTQITTTGSLNDNYTFTTYGNLTVSAVVNFTLNGATVSNGGSGTPNPCVKSYTTALPSTPNYSCQTIAISPDPSNANGIVATNTETSSTGVTLTGVDYNFGDSNTTAVTNLSNLTVTHVYSAPGQYTVSVADTFLSNGTSYTVSGPNCVLLVTIAAPPSTPKCTIAGLTEYPANSPNCVVAIVPAKLVNTGPGGLGTFLIILGVAAVVSGGSYYLLGKKRNHDPLDSL